MIERRNSGKWFSLLVLISGVLLILADVSNNFDLWGITPGSLAIALTGLLLLSKQSPLNADNQQSGGM
ncbi:MAG: hypothetical protein ACXADH_13690 [Candidatus Kariarchaeaceae archaeon]|jgi:drug/metabolite transporter (DMT)-like permease